MIRVKDAMVKDVITVDASTKLIDVLRVMGEMHIGSVVVTREGRPVGIFTERDMISRVLLKSVDTARSVEEFMSKPITGIGPDYDLKEAARAMVQLNVKRLPVVEDGRLIGIITSSDIVRAIAEEPSKI